ncbi:MAG: ComEC/Rec2 family competence protein, partial [Parcubacteria group bacterium]|nr:ComEC/Rec2 family competence protein [Parcubacteria group bacterium]
LVPSKFQFREFAIATVSTQIFVLPLLLYKMGELSLVALPVNLLVLVVVPITMLFGFLAGVVGLLSTVLSLPFAFISYGLLTYQLTVVDFFARPPFASVQIDNFPLMAVLIMYTFYAFLIWKLK